MTALPVPVQGSTVAVVPPQGSPGRPVGWWGMLVLIATEAVLFLGLLSSYFFLRAQAREWPLGGIKPPELTRISIFTVVLLASSVPLFWGEHAIARGRMRQLRVALLLSFVLGLAFIVNQGVEYRDLTFGWRDNAYASAFYVITGLHGLHVVVGLLMNLVVQLKAWKNRLSAERHLTVKLFSLYWHFVDVVWIFVFSSLYLSAHLR
ncbi:MAG TPA: cytochrome c oxidase subunit 3 [Acidimicrobiales bacterium]|nr:cytochrome c oxidase subunit 3 [Acidimicrobiales bacterium]